MIPTGWMLSLVFGGVLLAASPSVGEDAQETAAPPPLLAEAPLRIDAGTDTLVLEPIAGPREAGLPVQFRVRFGTDDGAIPVMPAPGTILGDFEVVPCDTSSVSPSPKETPSACWSIRTFGSGDVALPSFDVRVGGTTVTVPARTIQIGSVIGAETGLDAFRDIADAVEIRRPVPIWIWLIGAGTLVLVAIIVLVLLRRPRRPHVAPPPVPADVWALGALERLAARDLPRNGAVQGFFIELTDVVRSFVERRYDISAPERTTREFIREAERHPLLSTEQAAMLGKLLRSADLVKFAGDRPASAECDRSFEIVKAFVISAGPKPAAPDERDSDRGSERGVSSDVDHVERRREVRNAVAGLDELEVDPG